MTNIETFQSVIATMRHKKLQKLEKWMQLFLVSTKILSAVDGNAVFRKSSFDVV
jgi:hypothetical protein